MRDKEDFYISTVLAKMFEIPSSTIGQLISGKKYIGGAELEKFRAEMEQKGVPYLIGKNEKQEVIRYLRNQSRERHQKQWSTE